MSRVERGIFLAENDKYNLSEGPIFGKLLNIAVPIMGSQLVQMAYSLIGMFWLGRVGSDAVAASGTAGMYTWMAVAFMAFGRMGAEIGVSQNLGRGDENTAKTYVQTSFSLALLLGLVFGIVMIFGRGFLIGFFNIKEASVAASAENYLAITGFAMPFNFLLNAGGGTYNGSGNSRLPFYINAICLSVNIVLDPILIFVFDLGVEGAALATVISQLLGFILFIWAMKFYKNRLFKEIKLFETIDKKVLKQIFKWAMPIALESFLFTFLLMFISKFVTEFGTGAMAAQRIGGQIESLSWFVASGFSTAMAAFTGQNFGAGKWRRIHEGFRLSTIMMGTWGIIVTAILFFGGGFIFSLFLPNEPEVIETGANYMKILALCQILSCLENITSGTFRGLGNTIPPSLVSITSNFIRMIAAYFLSKTSMGLDGIWWALTLGAMLRGGWMFSWYKLYARKLPKADNIG